MLIRELKSTPENVIVTACHHKALMQPVQFEMGGWWDVDETDCVLKTPNRMVFHCRYDNHRQIALVYHRKTHLWTAEPVRQPVGKG